ncbi:hypothetical protein pdam_00000086 [Pocillopora damicornis]|uniref:Uncharacterized protein n=1 Tax=Pocillopora damicornis TaxID=46731 RepID=A0A3M6UXJ5_POCDA|nr:hypothetical protein pdam_00000086 [Pocillopora damicornis]
MQSIEQHYYRETEEHNYNGCKLLVKKDDMLDSLDDKKRSCDNSTNGINFTIRKAAQAHVSRKSQRLIHERVTRCVTRC